MILAGSQRVLELAYRAAVILCLYLPGDQETVGPTLPNLRLALPQESTTGVCCEGEAGVKSILFSVFSNLTHPNWLHSGSQINFSFFHPDLLI